ncbi:MAG TPA: hypothetical protein VFU22_01755 [Roseiflexaceae bacterium]|nr:hypothetical protein [Roseiflexaceae bacterium]
MDGERVKIMQMLADGTITADEADLLLEAVEAAPAATGQTQRIAPAQPETRQQPATIFANLTLDQLIELRTHGVDPKYIQAMRAAGLGDLPFGQLLEAGMHGVRPEYIHEMRAAGLGDLSFDQIVEASIHGVRPEYIHEMRAAGLGDLPIDKLVELRIHGVSPDFIRQMRAVGG